MSDHALFDARESRGRPGPFIPETAYRNAEALLAESRTRQEQWQEICAAAGKRLTAACERPPGPRGPGGIMAEFYPTLRDLLTAAKRAGETDLLFGVLFRHVPIANHADLATWCRAQQTVLYLYESHYGPQAYHVLLRRPGEAVELSEFDVIRLAIPLLREYPDVTPIADKIGTLEARFGKGPRIKPPEHVGPEPLRGVVHFAWHLMREQLPGVDRPPEPESVPDAPAARRAFDAVIRWCEKQSLPPHPPVATPPQAERPTMARPLLPDEAWLSHVELASHYELVPENLRKRLDGWRKKHAAGDGWKEVAERGPREPKYLYRVGAVRSIAEDMAESASGETSG